MIRLGGSPYASHTPQIVVTVVQIITAYTTTRRGSGRQHQDDHERPDRQADHRDAVENARDANATTAVTEITVGRMAPSIPPQAGRT